LQHLKAVFIITGDQDLLVQKKHQSIRIVSPREFWKLKDKDRAKPYSLCLPVESPAQERKKQVPAQKAKPLQVLERDLKQPPRKYLCSECARLTGIK
jgi:hypothetical protein